MIKIIVQLLSSFLGRQLKIVADTKIFMLVVRWTTNILNLISSPAKLPLFTAADISWFIELSNLITAIVFSSLNSTGLEIRFKMLVIQQANNMNILVDRHSIKLSVQKLEQKLLNYNFDHDHNYYLCLAVKK